MTVMCRVHRTNEYRNLFVCAADTLFQWDTGPANDSTQAVEVGARPRSVLHSVVYNIVRLLAPDVAIFLSSAPASSDHDARLRDGRKPSGSSHPCLRSLSH